MPIPRSHCCSFWPSVGGPATEARRLPARRHPGREFGIVIFGTVEGGERSRDRWMACSHLQPAASTWPRDGVRLFDVAVTRVKTRLYAIAGGERVKKAGPSPVRALRPG